MKEADRLLSAVLAFVEAQAHTHAQPVWAVGGFVRDVLLGRPTHDLDLVVPEGGVRLARAIANAFDGAAFILDEERDVGRAIVRGAAEESVLEIDVARLRAPELLDDLSLRDFTINAMAHEIGQGAIGAAGAAVIDPFGGRDDLTRRLVRAVTEGALRDDPLRALRAVRQSIELDFRIEGATYSLIRRDAPLIAAVAGERVRDELLRILCAPGAWQHLRTLAGLDLLPHVLPESAAQAGVQQSAPHYQEVFDHTCAVLAHLEGLLALLWPDLYQRPLPLPRPAPRPASVDGESTVIAADPLWDDVAAVLAPYADELRAHLARPVAANRLRRDWLFWAALTHDWGKPAMRSVGDDGKAHFYEHDHWGAVLVQHRGRALKLAGDEIGYLAKLTAEHMRPGFLAHDYPLSRRALYRYYRDLGDHGPDCALLSLADSLATRATERTPQGWTQRLGATDLIMRAYFLEHGERVAPKPLLDGRQLMAELGLAPGPLVGRLLEDLREAQAVGEVATFDEAIIFLSGRRQSL